MKAQVIYGNAPAAGKLQVYRADELSLTSVLHVVLKDIQHPRHLGEQQDPVAPLKQNTQTLKTLSEKTNCFY